MPNLLDEPVRTAEQPSARAFFKDVLLDQRAIWLSPFTASGSDAKWLVSVGLTTAALIGTDKEITTNIDTSGNRQRNWGRVSEIGSGYALAGTAAAFYLTGRLTHNERARATGLLSAEALVDELIVVSALKEATNRVRPSTDNGRQDFYDGGSAFPSGHTAATWAVAAVVAEQYRDKPAVGWTAYGLASLVGVARVMALKHSPSDVFVGGVIGYLIGRHVVRRAAGDHGRTSVLVTPYVDPRTRGFGVAGSLSF